MMHGYFEGLKQPDLPKGKYYTQFSYNFTFGDPGKDPEIETGKMTFKINFEVSKGFGLFLQTLSFNKPS